MTAFVADFSPVTHEVSAVFGTMQGLYLAVASVVIALLLSKQKHYWLVMLGLAVVTAVILQLIAGAAVVSLALVYKIIAFMVYAYLLQLIRFMW
jgi:hypothetical protein